MAHLTTLAFTVFALTILAGCAKNSGTTTPTPPQAPQLTVEQYVTVAAAAENAAAHELLALCTTAPGATAPILDSGTCGTVKTYLVTVEGVLSAISAEAASTDPWSCSSSGAPTGCTLAQTMKYRISNLIATAVLNATVSNPNLKAEISSLQATLAQILEVQ